MIPTLALLATLAPGDQPVTMTLIPSGATERVKSFKPIIAELGESLTLVKVPAGLGAPRFGTLVVAGKKTLFLLDEKAPDAPRLIVDVNGNGDLSDDPPADWKVTRHGEAKTCAGSVMLDLGMGAPVRIMLYRNDPSQPLFANAIGYYADYGYELAFKLDGKPFTSLVPAEVFPGSRIKIDRNGDGKISVSREIALVGKPFNFTGTTYAFVKTPTGLELRTANERLPVAPMPADLSAGTPTLPIQAVALDGSKVDLLKDYRGKLVMVDFWATWCGPCMRELPNVEAAYAANHDKGFEILGVSFDKNEYGADKLKAFLVEKGMPWRQIYEGKFWDTAIGKEFDVSSIPFTILVDGDTGKIVAQGEQMRGTGLSTFIAKKLVEKKAVK